MPICMHPAAQSIAHARDIGAYTAFHQGEIPYLCATPALNEAQKILWLWIAHKTAFNPARGLRRAQESIGKHLAKSRGTIHAALKVLSEKDFLGRESMHRHAGTYLSQFPTEGMAALARDTPILQIKKEGRPTLYDYRRQGGYRRFGKIELSFVLEHPALSDLEKLTWCLLANESALSPELCTRHSYKALGLCLGKKENTMNKVIDSLKAQGFIKVDKDPEEFRHWMTLSLPEPALKLLTALHPRAGAKQAPSLEQATLSPAPDFFAQPSDISVYKSDEMEPISDFSEQASDEIVHHLSTDLSKDEINPIITNNSCARSADSLENTIATPALQTENAMYSNPVVPVSPQPEALEKAAQVLNPQYLALREAMHSSAPITHEAILSRMQARLADPIFYEKICRFHAETAAAKEAAYLAGICPEREAWVLPLPDTARYRPPGNANTSMSERVCNYWIRHVNARKDAIKAAPDSTPPLTEEEQSYHWRALRAPRLDPHPFPKGSAFATMAPEARLAQIPHYMALLQKNAPLAVEEVRHWRHTLWERSYQMGFEGALNFYVFDSFCPLSQVLIRLAMRSPKPAPLQKVEKTVPDPRRKPTKAAYGDYPIAEQLEARAKLDIPRFIHEGEFPTAVAKRGAATLIAEVLFYLAKHACIIQQSDRLKTAYMVCRRGKWDIPIGMYMS